MTSRPNPAATLDEPAVDAGRIAAEGPVKAPPPSARPRRGGKVFLMLAVLAGLLAAAGVYRFQSSAAGPALPTAEARSGEFLTIVRCRGELRARRSAQIIAPVNVPELRIIWLAPAGEPVEAGSPVVRFDPSSAQQQLAEKQASLEQAQATLDHADAEARITAEQDRLDLSNARYEVERARLEVSKAEILSAMQAEQSRIALDLADEKLKVQEATVRLHEASSQSKIASLTRARDEAQSQVEVTEYRLSQMELKAPLSGVIVFLENRSQGWLNAQPFKVGDQVWPGGAIAEIPDLATLEMEGKLEEIDRGKIEVNDEVRVRIDALPELSQSAVLQAISPLTQQGFEWPPTRTFRGYAPLANPDPRLRPGMNGAMDVVIDRIPDAVIVPAQAVFTRGGKPVVYVPGGGTYRPVEIEVIGRNPDEFAVSGLQAGSTIALVEPEAIP
jgi:multidrug efflux pump subunit AcrA (membrane-fusion protein)